LVTGLTVVGDVGTNLTGLYFALSYGDGWKVVEYSVVTALALTAVGDEVVKVVKLGNKAKNPTRKVAQEIVEYINVDVDLPTGKLKGFSLPTQLKTVLQPLELLKMTNRQEVIQQLVELKVHTHEKLFEAFKKAKINPEFLAKIDARPAWLREWAGNILGGLKGLFKRNAIKFSPEELTQLLEVKWNDDGVLDVFVHAEGDKFFGYIEKNGKLEKVDLEGQDIIQAIKNADPDPNGKTPIRLLSCANLKSAEELSTALDGRKIVASDESVKVFDDGTVESGQWFEIAGTSKKEIPNPTPPTTSTNKQKFVRMGYSNSISDVIHDGKQGKHIVGHNNYIEGKSILTSNAQSLLNQFHSGTVASSELISDYKARVDFGETIGIY